MSSKSTRVRLAGRYQGWLAPFVLRFDAVAGRYWRAFTLEGRTWNDPRSYTPEEAQKLVRIRAWCPLSSGETGTDFRPLRRFFEVELDRRGEELLR